MIKMKCEKCGYEWQQRVAEPKRCPRCGRWLKKGDKEK